MSEHYRKRRGPILGTLKPEESLGLGPAHPEITKVLLMSRKRRNVQSAILFLSLQHQSTTV